MLISLDRYARGFWEKPSQKLRARMTFEDKIKEGHYVALARRVKNYLKNNLFISQIRFNPVTTHFLEI